MATLAATPEAKKARNDEACSTAETFVNLYYERVDSKRHLIGKHTLCTGHHTWTAFSLLTEKQTHLHISLDKNTEKQQINQNPHPLLFQQFSV